MKRALFAILLLIIPLGAKAQEGLPDIDYGPDYSLTGTFRPLTMPPMQLPVTMKPLLPELESFVSYNIFQRQYGLTVPAASMTRDYMLLDSRGYMPLYGRGDFGLGLTGSLQTYTSFGFSNSVSLGTSYAPTEWLTLYGGVYASDNMLHMTRFKDFGVSGKARIQLAERLFLNAYGHYSIYSNRPQTLPMGMYPGTSFGGTIEVKISEHFGVEGGAFREYDPFSRQWRTQYYAAPVFY